MTVDYFEQDAVWRDALDEYQVQTSLTIADLMPGDVRSVLDVGCGDGGVSRPLAARVELFGVDRSRSALRRFAGRAAVGDATELPFADRAFDLVMANDVLEHLDPDALRQTLAELRRVSRRYVLLTVPLREAWLDNTWICARCGARSHVNLHVGAWTEERLLGVFGDGEGADGLVPLVACYSGALYDRPSDGLQALRDAVTAGSPTATAVCGRCGHKTTGLGFPGAV